MPLQQIWLFDYRASILLPASQEQFTGDDIALKDYPLAVNTVRKITGARDIQVVAHCFGATTFIMSILAGLQGVRSAVCSQVATHMTAPLITRVKVSLYLARLLWLLGADSLDASPEKPLKLRERFFDLLLQLYPITKGERCSNTVCRRVAFMYAPLYRHAHLSESMHHDMKSLFGSANLNAFMHLSTMIKAGFVVNKNGANLYLPWIRRLNMPVTFIHGSKNVCFLPESTEITYRILRDHNEKDLYKRILIPAYSHIDCMNLSQ